MATTVNFLYPLVVTAGGLLFTGDGYPVPWDSTYNGGLVPVGTYYYAIELNDPRFPEPYTGPLTVIR